MAVALILARHGSPAQRALLDTVIAGDLILTYAVQEPNTRWSLDAVGLRGRRSTAATWSCRARRASSTTSTPLANAWSSSA